MLDGADPGSQTETLERTIHILPSRLKAGHERGRRAGTEGVLLFAALGAACEIARPWIGMPSVEELRGQIERDLESAKEFLKALPRR